MRRTSDYGDAALVGIGTGALIALCVIGLALFHTVAGALIGWIVGAFFGPAILDIAAQLGIRDVAMWQLGAFLGFVGGFFRSSATAKVTKQRGDQ